MKISKQNFILLPASIDLRYHHIRLARPRGGGGGGCCNRVFAGLRKKKKKRNYSFGRIYC